MALNDADLMNIVCSDISGPSSRTRHYSNHGYHGNHGNHRAVGAFCPRRSSRKDSEVSERKGSGTMRNHGNHGNHSNHRAVGPFCPRRSSNTRRRSSRKDSEESGRKGSGNHGNQGSGTVRIRHYIDEIESSFLSNSTTKTLNRTQSSAKIMRAVFGQATTGNPNKQEIQVTGEKQQQKLRRRSSQHLPMVTFSPSPEPGRRGSLFVQSPSHSPSADRRGSLFIRSPSPAHELFATSTPIPGRALRSRSMYAWNGGDEGNKTMLLR